MHIQVVNFNLNGISEEDYRKMADGRASIFASVPGLISKVWLADTATNTYGGIYTWRDRAAMEAYKKSDIFQGALTNPKLANLTSRDFAVLESPTRVTRGLVAAAV